MDLSRPAAARILGVTVDATQEEIKKAYKARVMVFHPDKGGSDEHCQLLNMAHSVMMGKSNHTKDVHYTHHTLPTTLGALTTAPA